MASKSKKPAAGPSASKANTLTMRQEQGKSRERMMAESALASPVASAITARTFATGRFGELDLTESMAVMVEQVNKARSGDLSGGEGMLMAQAVALDSIFNELARRAALNMGEHMQAMETYVRLALKAQSQCRTTLETLATIKNPPVVFARQANIAHGPQQVNNGVPNNVPHAHACEKKPIQSNELLTDGVEHGPTLDNRGTPAAGGADKELATMGAIDRPAHG